MNRRGVVLTLLAAAVLAAAGAWWSYHYRLVERSIPQPPRGEAAYNPLYALKLALRADGVRAQSRQRLRLDRVKLGARDTVVLWSDPRNLPWAESTALIDWVSRGGHLVLRTPPPIDEDDSDRGAALLELLDVGAPPGSPQCMPLQVPGSEPHVQGTSNDSRCPAAQGCAARDQAPERLISGAESGYAPDSAVRKTARKAVFRDSQVFCGGRRFHVAGERTPLLAWGDREDGYVYARFAQGRGFVDLAADLDVLGNRGLREAPHRALARQLLQPNYRAGTMHLIYAAQMPSLWRLLLLDGWPALLPALLALLAWLWMRRQCFGPLLPSPPDERRSLLEHVQASGELLYRYGQSHLLYAAVHRAFLARLRRRDPLAAALDGQAQAAAIADRLQATADRAGADAAHAGHAGAEHIGADHIAAALQAPVPRDTAALRQRIALLIKLRNRI